MSDCEFLDLVSAMFFRFRFLAFFLFFSVEMKICCGFVMALGFWSEIVNLVFWIEDLGSLVLVLFSWMHISIQHDWFYPDVAQKVYVRTCSVLRVAVVHRT
jgi:hypothetical protein